VQIQQVATNGPYAYVIMKDGVGAKAVNNVASIGAALDGVKADIAGMLSGETVTHVGMTVASS